MAITLRQALTLAQVLHKDELLRKDVDSGDMFDASCLEGLRDDHRKTLYTALELIENSPLAHFKKIEEEGEGEVEERSEIDNEIVEITSIITGKKDLGSDPKHAWYAMPWIWIGKAVHGLIMGCKNLFFGGVGKAKLRDRVAQYVNDRLNAKASLAAYDVRIKELKKKCEEENGKQREFLAKYIGLLDAENFTTEIALRFPSWLLPPDFMSFQREKECLIDEFIVGNINKDLISLQTITEVVSEQFNKAPKHIQNRFQDLFESAQAIEEKGKDPEDVEGEDLPKKTLDEKTQVFTRLFNRKIKAIEELKKKKYPIGKEHRNNVEKALDALKKEIDEKELTIKKYALSPIKDPSGGKTIIEEESDSDV